MFKFHVIINVYNYITSTIVGLEYNGYIYGIIILDMIPKVGDLILVKTKLNGNKICIVDSIIDDKIHFKNKKIGMEVNLDRIVYKSTKYRGANFEYSSFN